MGKGTITPTADQRKAVLKLGDLPEGTETTPKGVSPFDVGAPPAADDAHAEIEEAAKAELKAATDGPESLEQSEAEKLVKRPHEEWAKQEGYLPASWLNAAAVQRGRFRAVAPTPNPKHWIYRGALARYQWPIGKEMTLAEFRAAIAKAHDFKIYG